jgi:hypothetical protein
MKDKLIGFISAVLAWKAFDVMIPQRIDEPADIWVPLVGFFIMLAASTAVWIRLWWSKFLAAVLCLLQLGSALYLGLLHDLGFALSRFADIIMLILATCACIRLLIYSKKENRNGKVSV